jgi:two-component system, cell cycle sensor histidine kinase and response regulator CckA
MPRKITIAAFRRCRAADDEDWWVGIFWSKVRPAAGGLQALEIYRRERDHIDLVILDMLMPGMGGAATFQKLQRIAPGVRVLLSSGNSLDGKAQEAMAAGARGFIQKPYRLAALSHRVAEILGTS